MVDVQDGVFRLARTPLTGMMVSGEHIFAHIPEAKLWPLLVRHPFNLWMSDLLNIELRDLNGGLAYWQDSVNQLDRLEVSIDPMLDRRCKPPFWFSTMEEPRLSIARFSTPACSTKLTTRGEQLLDISSWHGLCLEQHGLLGGRRYAHMARASIDPQGYLLLVPTAAIEQLNSKWDHPDNLCLASFEHYSRLVWATRHQWLIMTI